MIVHSICIQGWGCFCDPVEVGPLSDDINVIYAPNGSGKSTLFWALIRGLIDSHRTKGREVEALRPWGRDLAPKVTIEFSHGGTDYIIIKGFLEAAKSELKRKENGVYKRLAETDKADQFVQDLLTRNVPQRGLSKAEQWGMAQVLWAPQGELSFSSLSGDLVSDIHNMLGIQISGPGSNNLEERIKEQYEKYYTPGGKLKSGRASSALVVLQEQLGDAQQRRLRAIELQQEFEEKTRKVEELRSKQIEATHTAQEFGKNLKEIRPRAQEYERLLSLRLQYDLGEQGAAAEYSALKQHIESIMKIRKELLDKEEEQGRLEEEVALRNRELASQQLETDNKKSKREDVRKSRPIVKQAQDEADFARQYLNMKSDSASLEERLRKIKELGEQIRPLEEERNKIVTPDKKQLKKIREVIKARDEASIRLDASLITLEIVPYKNEQLNIIEAETSGSKTLSPNESIQVKGSPQVIVEILNIARIRASGPESSIEEIRKEVDKYSKELSRLTTNYGTSDIADLENLAEDASRIDSKINELKARIETILGEQSIEEVEVQIVNIQSGIRQIEKQHLGWAENPPDLPSLKQKAEDINKEFVTEVETAEKDHELSLASLRELAEHKAEASAHLDDIKKQMKGRHRDLDELIKDGKADTEREKELVQFALKWDAAKAALQEVENKINEFETDPRIDVERLEKLRQSAEDEAKKAFGDEKEEEGKLNQLAAQGTYTALAKIEEEINTLEENLKREQLSANAIALLYNMVRECRERVVASISVPVEKTASRILKQIAGGRLGEIKFNENFVPSSVSPQLAGDPVTINRVSGGEQEQIYLATRIALAEVFAKDGKQLVVLDDVLAATDSGRLGRVLTVLEEASEQLQIVVLSCHPERYGALREANFIDLEKIIDK